MSGETFALSRCSLLITFTTGDASGTTLLAARDLAVADNAEAIRPFLVGVSEDVLTDIDRCVCPTLRPYRDAVKNQSQGLHERRCTGSPLFRPFHVKKLRTFCKVEMMSW